MDVPRCGKKGVPPRWVVVGRTIVSSMRRVHQPAVALHLARTPRFCGAAHCSEILTSCWFTSHRQIQTLLAPRRSRKQPAGLSCGSEGCSVRAPSTRPQLSVGRWRRARHHAPLSRLLWLPPLHHSSQTITHTWRHTSGKGGRGRDSTHRGLCETVRGGSDPHCCCVPVVRGSGPCCTALSCGAAAPGRSPRSARGGRHPRVQLGVVLRSADLRRASRAEDSPSGPGMDCSRLPSCPHGNPTRTRRWGHTGCSQFV